MMDSLLAGERLNRKAQRCTQTRRKRTPWTTLRRDRRFRYRRVAVWWRGPATCVDRQLNGYLSGLSNRRFLNLWPRAPSGSVKPKHV